MENASKALIIAASVLITVMLMSFMVFTFRRFKSIAKDTETNLSELEIEAFNAKFTSYDTGGTHQMSDTIGITFNRGRGTLTSPDTRQVSFNEIFNRNGFFSSADSNVSVKDRYHKALVAASQSLNTASNVVTAINDAIDANYKNSNSYLYGYVETQTCVEIIVDLSPCQTDTAVTKFSKGKRYLVIEPNANVKAKYVYWQGNIVSSGSNTQNRVANIANFVADNSDSGNSIKVYDMLENLRDTEIIVNDGKEYVVYKYYFFGQVFENPTTHLVETVKFTITKDNKFGVLNR